MKISSLIVLLFFSVFSQSLWAGTEDSLKNKYDINDPRNPNCPCHKYQRQAEDEYKALLALQNNGKWKNDDLAKREESNNSINPPLKTNDYSTTTSAGNDKLKKREADYSKKHKPKRKGKKYNKWRRICGVNKWDIWKRVRNTDSCYRW